MQNPLERPLTPGFLETEVESSLPKVSSVFDVSPTPPITGQTGQLHAATQPSSDYGNDSLDEIPSPSTLVPQGVSTSSTSSGKEEDRKPRDNTESQVDHSIFDLTDDCDWIDLDEPWLPVIGPQPATPVQNENNTCKDKGIDATHKPPKRLFPFTDENRSRLKQRKTLQSNDESTSLSGRLGPELEPKLAEILVESNTMNLKSSATEATTENWDDIDPSLLDEFKDIVNFL